MSNARHEWIVVANAARARVLEGSDDPGVYVHARDLVHVQSRQKGVELAAAHGGDRAGQFKSGSSGGSSSGAFTPKTDPRDREKDRFAREVAQAVNEGVAAGRCSGITLIASDPFLGHLKSHLDAQAHKLLRLTLARDYTTLRDEEVLERIGGPLGQT
jgi:protein required for attachment to host cells